jgi:ABC-type lipoprotein export system ATPase subunit
VIELDDVFVLYRGAEHDVVALRGLTLRVEPGERVVVNGPSGSGKSTLVKVVTAEVLPGAGRAIVLGQNLGQLGAAAARTLRRERVAIITQGSGRDLAPELSCLQNVALQGRLTGQTKLAANAQARAVMATFGVEHLADRRPATLSGGEAQRVGVAAALASRPGVIVADEPTGELDQANAQMVYDLLAEHAAATQAGLLLVTHDARANRIADRVVTMRDGRVSSELDDGMSRLIVDQRGWVRLPDVDRARAHIGGRARVLQNIEGLVLAGDSTLLESEPPAHIEVPKATGAPILIATAVSLDVGGVRVLAPTSVSIRAGELTVLAGASGSGKTSLLGLIAGLGEPTSGTVHREGACSVSVFSSLAGFAEQVSVTQNLQLARQVRRLPHADVRWALSELGIAHLADRPIAMLSGGERQRAGIARALVSGTDIVLLDEPTSQLDEASAGQVARVLQQLAKRGQAIVCTSHDSALIDVGDQVVFLGGLPTAAHV